MNKKHWTMIVPGAVLLCASPAFGVELRDAVQSALTTNPEIRQAVSNRAATAGRAGAGAGPLLSAHLGRRFGRRAQPAQPDAPLDRHRRPDAVADRGRPHRRPAAVTTAAAARPKSAARRRAPTPPRRASRSARNSSRSTSRAPTSTICSSSGWSRSPQDNVTFHERLAGDLREGVAKGSISIADQQQAEERLQAARARVTEAREDLDTAGDHVPHADRDSDRQRVDAAGSVAVHAGHARGSRSRWRGRTIRGFAKRSPTSPRRARKSAPPRPTSGRKFNLEGRARAGHDIDGFAGRTTDLQALGVIRWTLYNGGTKEANVREQQHRADEVHGRLFERTRAAEEDVRTRVEPPAEPDRAGERAGNAGPDHRRLAAVLSRAVQHRPPLAARRARCAEHALQRPGADRDRAARQALCAISRARRRPTG